MYFDDDIIEGINKTEKEINESECGFKVETIVNEDGYDSLNVCVEDNVEYTYASDTEAYSYLSGIKKCLEMMNVM